MKRMLNILISTNPLERLDNAFECFVIACGIFHAGSITIVLTSVVMLAPLILASLCFLKHDLDFFPSAIIREHGSTCLRALKSRIWTHLKILTVSPWDRATIGPSMRLCWRIRRPYRSTCYPNVRERAPKWNCILVPGVVAILFE